MSENQNPAPEPAGPDQRDPLPPGLFPPVTAAAPLLASPPVPGAQPNRGLAVASLILGAFALLLDFVLALGFFFAVLRRVAALLGLTENYVATLHAGAARDGSAALIQHARPGRPGKLAEADWADAV